MQHGNGKRWLLIGLFVLGGFWLVNDAYDDGYRDALVQTGQMQDFRRYDGGPNFPWGLLIFGGIGYLVWRKGAFDRFGGTGGPFGNGGQEGERGMQHYGTGSGPAQTPGATSGHGGSHVFRGPRAFFEEWHRQAHEESARIQRPAPPAPPVPSTAAVSVNYGASQERVASTPPPTPPAPEYWTSMGGAAGSAGIPGAPAAPPASPSAQQDENPNTHHAAGTAV